MFCIGCAAFSHAIRALLKSTGTCINNKYSSLENNHGRKIRLINVILQQLHSSVSISELKHPTERTRVFNHFITLEWAQHGVDMLCVSLLKKWDPLLMPCTIICLFSFASQSHAILHATSFLQPGWSREERWSKWIVPVNVCTLALAGCADVLANVSGFFCLSEFVGWSGLWRQERERESFYVLSNVSL